MRFANLTRLLLVAILSHQAILCPLLAQTRPIGEVDANQASSSNPSDPSNSADVSGSTAVVSDETNKKLERVFGTAAHQEFQTQYQTTRDAITSRQQRLQESAAQSPELLGQLQTLYQDSLKILEDALNLRSSAADWRERVSGAPELLQQVQSQKSELSDSGEGAELRMAELHDLSYEEAQLELQKLEKQLSEVQTLFSDVTGKISFREARRKELPGLISAAKEGTKESSSGVKDADDPLVSEALQWKQKARDLAAQQERLNLESELQAYEAEAPLLPIQLELAREQKLLIQEDLKRLQEAMAQKRASRIHDIRSRIQVTTLPSDDVFSDIRYWLKLDVIEEPSDAQKRLSWFDLAREHDEVQRELEQSRAELQRWRELRTRMVDRIDPNPRDDATPRTNRWVVERLRKQRSELPSISSLTAQLRDYQRMVEAAESMDYDVIDATSRLMAWRSQVGVSSSSAEDFENQARLSSEALESLTTMLSAIKTDLDVYLTDLYALADIKEQTINLSEDYESFIDKQLLWTPSANRLGFDHFKTASDATVWFLRKQNWEAVVRLIVADVNRSPVTYVLFVVCMCLLIYRQPTLRSELRATSQSAERKTCTSFSLSTKALLQTLLIAAPFPIVLLFIAWRLQVSCAEELTQGFPYAFANGLLLATAALFPMALLRQVCVPHGLGTGHFDWRDEQTAHLNYHLRWLINLSVPLLVVIGVFAAHSEASWEKSAGRVTFVLLMFLLAAFVGFVLHPKRGVFSAFVSNNEGGWVERLKVIWYPASIMIPISLALLSVAGYHYTSQQLATRLDITLWMVILLTVAFSLVERWLLLSRREMMMQQARQRLEAASKQTSSDFPQPLVNDEEVRVSEISEQTRRMMTSAFVFGGLLLAFFIWADVLPAISMLDNVVLWRVTGETPEDTVPISLSNLLLVIPIIVLTTVATRNVPGLLEIAFLQHLPLTKAARYAITTLARYAIVGVGIFLASYTIGLKWSSIQWLVAGLGVGLGFGLQEIFANFISGIILLFEQPIRVGDVVTIDGTTGTVAKIRMRATTIINWDRQELIMPNKDLITGKLVNWTLTDTTNRIVVNVGVAYGSDSQQACEIVREVCRNHPAIMVDPAPIVTFEGFGDNTLNLVLRAYLSTLDNRLTTIHELHEEIYRAFNEAGVEIAFPQRDLHVRSLPEPLSRWISGQASSKEKPVGGGKNGAELAAAEDSN